MKVEGTGKDEVTSSFWDRLAITEDDLTAAEEKAREKRETGRSRDGRICICGHSARRHQHAHVVTRCVPARMTCPCRGLVPVMEVSDTRGFVAKTEGPGVDHALIKGVLSARRLTELQGAELKMEWLVELRCQRCGSEEKVLPVAVTASGFVSNDPEAGNGLLCGSCIGELGRFS